MPPTYDSEEARIICNFRSDVGGKEIPTRNRVHIPRLVLDPGRPGHFIPRFQPYIPPPGPSIQLKVPSGYEPMLVNEIDKQIAKDYRSRVLHLTLTEDPLEGQGDTTVFGRDREGVAIQVKILLELPQEILLRLLAFGATIGVIDPYYRVGEEWCGIVVDPEQVIHVGGKKDLCRYCGKENAQIKCLHCQAGYCNQRCQQADWNDLNHKALCTSEYFHYLQSFL